MAFRPFKSIRIAHAVEGRLRVRITRYRNEPAKLTRLVERLSSVEGVFEVQARPFTGSVLVEYDPDLLDHRDLLAVMRLETGIEKVLRPGEEDPEEIEALATIAATRGSVVARAMSSGFKSLNMDILRATDGRVDLGSILALGFLSAGAAEVAATRKLPAPPWFNLAWWAFRTFTELEKPAIATTVGGRAHDMERDEEPRSPSRSPSPRPRRKSGPGRSRTAAAGRR